MTAKPKWLTLKHLTETGGIVDTSKPKKKGRNRPRTAYELAQTIDGKRASAIAAVIAHANEGISEAEAIRAVVKASPEYKQELSIYQQRSAKQSLTRYKKAWSWPAKKAGIAKASKFLSDYEELERRCSGFPDDVRAKTDRWSADALLHYLRENDIDGTCPKEFVDFVRSQ